MHLGSNFLSLISLSVHMFVTNAQTRNIQTEETSALQNNSNWPNMRLSRRARAHCTHLLNARPYRLSLHRAEKNTFTSIRTLRFSFLSTLAIYCFFSKLSLLTTKKKRRNKPRMNNSSWRNIVVQSNKMQTNERTNKQNQQQQETHTPWKCIPICIEVHQCTK